MIFSFIEGKDQGPKAIGNKQNKYQFRKLIEAR
jgi:hypothetical protein